MSDKFFLVRSRIRVTEYMQDGHQEAIEQDMEIAQNEDQAQEKTLAYYSAKTVEYGICYCCDIMDVRSAIE